MEHELGQGMGVCHHLHHYMKYLVLGMPTHVGADETC